MKFYLQLIGGNRRVSNFLKGKPSRLITVHAPHPVESASFIRVLAEADKLGAPTIIAIEMRNIALALEGSHRLKAAEALNLLPKIILVPHDSYWYRHNDDTPVSAAEIASYFHDSLDSYYDGRARIPAEVFVEAEDWLPGKHKPDWLTSVIKKART